MAAIEWFRLWHDMPNDPKWRTIARASGQPIPVVISVALHVMVDASRNVTRGHVDVTAEDIASALDVTDEAVEAILEAMQGRILDGDRLTGWEKRQPKREDAGNPRAGAMSAAERKRLQREREKAAREAAESAGGDGRHDESREVTTDTDTDKDTDKEVFPDGNTYGASAPGVSGTDSPSGDEPGNPGAPDGPAAPEDPPGEPADGEKSKRALGIRELVAEGVDRQHAEDWLKIRRAKKAPLTETALDIVKREAAKAGITLAEAIAHAASSNWAGFKAKWLDQPDGDRSRQSAASGRFAGFEDRNYGTGGRL